MRTNRKLVTLFVGTILAIVLASTAFHGCTKNESTAPVVNPVFENITPEQAKDMIRVNSGNKSFVILDVRTPGEYNAGHIESAVNSDYYSDSFRENLDKMTKNKTYLIYCQSGNRSGKALDIMKELGFEQVYNMTGGMNAWVAEGFPVVK